MVLNTSFITAPVPPTLNENLLERVRPRQDPLEKHRLTWHALLVSLQPVFDYDFSRERVFLEIAAAEIAAKKQADLRLSNGIDEDADAALARQV